MSVAVIEASYGLAAVAFLGSARLNRSKQDPLPAETNFPHHHQH